MGNRSYLLDQDNRVLFEANDSLPLFWLGLLDQELLEDHRLVWAEYQLGLEKLEEDKGTPADMEVFWTTWQNKLDFVITQEAFFRNASQLRACSHAYFGELNQLTEDFLAFLTRYLPDQQAALRLDLLEYADFFESQESFFECLESQVRAISTQQLAGKTVQRVLATPLGEGCGFGTVVDGQSFASISPTYERYEELAKAPRSQANRRPKVFTVVLIGGLVVIALSLMVMFLKTTRS